MKLMRSVALTVVLFIVFITAQSFYKQMLVNFSKQKTTKNYSYRHISYCGPAFIEPDSVKDIPALRGWGNYHFKITTGSDSAQYYFDQGLSMYYAFHTIEAYASFSKANKLDTNCAMAWYGKALAMGPTINYPNDFKAPDAALEAARRSKVWARNCTPLELALIDAMQQRYSADTTISVMQLRRNYADAMQKVFNKYPKDADVLTLYADALMLLHPWDLYDHDFKAKAWTPQIRLLLEQALAISPKHPGANHYYIHTLEASGEPQVALKSAALLDTMMPSVSHITHMPSHIYIRTGNYQQGVINNDLAIAGYRYYLKSYAPVEESVALYEWHNIHLKVNCAQMGADYKDAMTGSKTLRAIVPANYLGLKSAEGNYAQYIYMQPLFTAVRFGKWDDVLKTTTPDTLPYATALMHFGRGLAFCGKGKITQAKKELLNLETHMKDAVLKSPMDNANTAYEAIVVGHGILKGMVAAGNGQYAIAITELEKAVVLEDRMQYGEPRDWPLPARHYLGTVLLKAGKYDKAVAVLNRDLFINPNNGWALAGLQTAYRHTRNAAQLNKIHTQLISASKIKDVTITAPAY